MRPITNCNDIKVELQIHLGGGYDFTNCIFNFINFQIAHAKPPFL